MSGVRLRSFELGDRGSGAGDEVESTERPRAQVGNETVREGNTETELGMEAQ